ncbi:hypothetical protein ACE193_02825 [Bernardetia sp. OM2101]|uniref:hypothetical protein n=1 Tax=Bernardetia sp. OM2101 TaxID=3344876 RepID=UPI0035D0AB36
MNIHKIDSHLHHSFLEEDRKDAITGDLIQANDEVVFCGVCKSAFLKGSWEYMDRKHCGQTKTLKKVPVSVPLLLNITSIKPHFITLTNVSTSFEECLDLLSSFNPKDKKIDILLDFVVKKGTQEYTNLLEKTTKKIEQDKVTLSTTQVEDESLVNSTTLIIALVLIGIVYFIPKDYSVLKVFPAIILFFLILALIQEAIDSIKEKFRAKREISKGKKTQKENNSFRKSTKQV